MMAEKGLRGGVSYIAYRYLKKNNNKYLNDYVKDEESSYLIYLLIMYTVWQWASHY